MGKISLDSIRHQLGRVEDEMEGVQVLSYPLSLSPSEIILNPNNTAALQDTGDDIRRLADSIEVSGLIHPLTVNKVGEHKYILLSGERRYKAITECLNWTAVPCTVYENLDDDMTAIVTIQANMEARSYTAAQRLALYEQLDAALRSQKAKGKLRGGISREAARVLGVSESQISKYKRIVSALPADELKHVDNIEKAAQDIRDNEKTFVTKVFDGRSDRKKNFRDESFSDEDTRPVSEQHEAHPEPESPSVDSDTADFGARLAVKTILRKYNELLFWAESKPESVRNYLYQLHAAIVDFQSAAGLRDRKDAVQ